MLSTVLYYELAMKVPIPVGITVYLLTWGLGHLRCLVSPNLCLLTTVDEFFTVLCLMETSLFILHRDKRPAETSGH